ncbi:MAG: hypothetical protein Sv326_0135 [Candidatus Fermentimicrarchaeum limneticum]|uniref:Nmd3 N-terminal domain-containing protein n=1 Tax=Fermentimicrarchaeum limneticum TaxID=2795018 RepID=A0A7D5XIZ2_FERL1|nr:MAG: hypothetical protein Sv326_0135 [Candidatus Fermentimicrarchaeum limneticum]
MEKICPRCGVLSGRKRFIGDFCEDCYLEMIGIDLPAQIELPFCEVCDRVKLAKWQKLDKNALEKFVKKNVKGRYDSFHITHLEDNAYEVVFLLSKDSNYLEVRRKFSLKKVKTKCDDCRRATSGYYEAILQIRGKKAERWSQKILKELQHRTFVSKYAELAEGIDMYVGSKKAVSETLGILKLTPKVSDKLYGVKDGKRVYRTTYCVRV